MEIDRSNSPGCFGSPVLRRTEHAICKTCRFRTGCHTHALVNERALCAQLGVTSLDTSKIERKRHPSKTPGVVLAEAPREAGLTKKGAQLHSSLARQEITPDKIREALTASNDESERLIANWKPEYVKVTIRNLRQSKSLAKMALRDAFERDLGWGRLAAQSHVSIATNALGHLGVIDDAGSTLKARTE